jgi:transposase
VARGKVHARCFRRHRHLEFIAFLNSLARRDARRELHLICDNYGTHKHPAVKQWLAAHPRIHLHFTPTGASWLSLVERWFALITVRPSGAAASTAFDGWRPRSPSGSQPGTRTPTRSAGPSPPPISNAASNMLHLFTRRDTRCTPAGRLHTIEGEK